jgi:hypothetical protein
MNAIRLLFIMLAMLVSAGAWAVDLSSVSNEELLSAIASRQLTQDERTTLATVLNAQTPSAEPADESPSADSGTEVAFPDAVKTVFDNTPLLNNVPRDREHILVENIQDGPTIVYAVVPKDQITNGTSLWQFYHQLGDGTLLDVNLHPLYSKVGTYNTFLAEAVKKMEQGAARHVKKQGFPSMQRDHDWVVPVMMLRTDDARAKDIIAWRTTENENPTT